MEFDWDAVQQAIREGRFTYGRHTDERRIRLGISDGDLQRAFGVDPRAEVLEQYPGDPRGASGLVLGYLGNRPLHVVCTSRTPLFFITLYEPEARRWLPGFRLRRR